MSIFRKKGSKAKKGEKGEKEKQQSGNDKPKQNPYKHVPKHAASDSGSNATIGERKADRDQIASESQKRLANARNDLAFNNGSYQRAVAHNAVHGTPSPSSSAGQQTRFSGMQRNSSGTFGSNGNTPPTPNSPMQSTQNAAQRNEITRNNRGYFTLAKDEAPSFDKPMQGNPTMQADVRDRRSEKPHYSADSGYGSGGPSSAAHSRAPSEHDHLGNEEASQHLPRSNSGFLPELSLTEQLAQEPAFSEHSFGEKPVEMPTKKAPESALKSNEYYSRDDQRDNLKPSKSSKSTTSSAPKQTRFEPIKSVQEIAQEQQPQTARKVQNSQPEQPSRYHVPGSYVLEAERDGRLKSSTLPESHPQTVRPSRSGTTPTADYEKPKPSFAAHDRQSTPPPARRNISYPPFAASARSSTPPLAEDREEEAYVPQAQFTYPARMRTPPPVNDYDQRSYPDLGRFSSPPPPPTFAPRERVRSSSVRSTLPSLGMLNGLKVNKRGKILDEEGEPIGELYEGDIMDCVRQRANDYGEVIDEYGTIVGRVRTLQRQAESAEIRRSTPRPSEQQQQQHYQSQSAPPPVPQTVTSPTLSAPRPERPFPHRQYISPQQQLAYHGPQQPALAQELRDYLAVEPEQHPQTAVAPLDFPRNGTRVELEASEPRQPELDDEDEMLIDQSEIFVPPSFVSLGSPNRPASPELSNQQAPVSPTAQPSRIPQSTQSSPEVSRAQAKRVSAPPAQPTPQAWAASEALDREVPRQSTHTGQSVRHSTQPIPTDQQSSQSAQSVRQSTQPVQYLTEEATQLPEERTDQRDMHLLQEQRQSLRTPSMPQARDTNNSSTSDMNESFSRPTFNSVPENEALPTEDRNPTVFAYKGDVPASHGPVSNFKVAPPRSLDSKSPPLPSFPRQAFTSSLPNGSPFTPMNSAQFAAPGGMGPRRSPAQFSTGMPGVRPGLAARKSLNQPLKRSPLSSHGRALSTITASDHGADDTFAETSPRDSDEGSADGRNEDAPIGKAQGMHSRQPSVRTMVSINSQQSSASKPRTYFTHAGRVTVDAGQPSPALQNAMQNGQKPAEKEAASSISEKSSEKKKRRFSMGFGKKAQAVAAH